MATRTEFKKLSLTRLQEAKVLYANGFYDGASYLAGYALELALKARICKLLGTDYPQNRADYGSFMTHKFPTLLRLAGLENALDVRKQNDILFASNWSILAGPSGWSETWRYQSIGKTQQASADLLDALENPSHGLLPWLKTKW